MVNFGQNFRSGIRLTESPSVVYVDGQITWGSNPYFEQRKLYCFFRGFYDKNLWECRFTLQGPDQALMLDYVPVPVPDTTLEGSPGATFYMAAIYVFHRGLDGGLYYNKKNLATGGGWDGDKRLADGLRFSPAAVSWIDKLWVVYPTLSGDQSASVRTTASQWEWPGSVNLVPGVGLSESPALVVHNESLYCYFQGMNGCAELWRSQCFATPTDWRDAKKMYSKSDFTVGGSASVISAFDTICVFVAGSGDRPTIWLRRDNSSSSEASPGYSHNTPAAVRCTNDYALVFYKSADDNGDLWYFSVGR